MSQLFRQALVMWTVYKHPKDFPDSYVARKWTITAAGEQPTQTAIVHRNLEVIQWQLDRMGLSRLERNPQDDPCIVETWL